MGNIFALKEDQRTALMAFLGGKACFYFTTDCKEKLQHVAPHTNRRRQAVDTWLNCSKQQVKLTCSCQNVIIQQLFILFKFMC